MARYTCSYIASPLERLQQGLIEILESCNFEVVYDTGDYLMAREVPGQVSFAKLVRVEVLIDRTTATEKDVRISFVMKNEELPLQFDNHCRKIFNLVQQAVAESQHWQLVETVPG